MKRELPQSVIDLYEAVFAFCDDLPELTGNQAGEIAQACANRLEDCLIAATKEVQG